MPELEINLDALNHNLHCIRRLEQDWGFSFLPVLKMVASHPAVVRCLRDQGYVRYGMADVTESYRFDHAGPAQEGCVLINLSSPDMAAEVVRRFERSAFSCQATYAALDAAARTAGLHHEVLLMVELGDLREGIPLSAAPALLRAVAAASRRAEHGPGAHVAGLGVNMGCLYGACPDALGIQHLEALASSAVALLGHDLDCVSVGGTIFWSWFARHRTQRPTLPAGCRLEFRMGDPLLLGYDIYREAPLQGADFRQDVFTLSAAVLEVTEREIRPPRLCVRNGRGLVVSCPHRGRRLRALVDCGSLHTEVSGLSLHLPGASMVDHSGNYLVLDLTDCPQPPAVGDRLRFAPSYWAVARACRTPQVSIRFTSDSSRIPSFPRRQPDDGALSLPSSVATKEN